MGEKNSQIEALNKLGQSIWYDNLSRDVLNSGELKSLISQGVSGLTSNPTIFEKAISGSSYYDVQIQDLVGKDRSVAEIIEELMISDVGAAADLLLPTYKATKSADGYASIEVSPLLAEDPQATLIEARRLWSKLDRPNIMIKVPATESCIPVIGELLYEGINVNVTLIFSVNIYKKVAEQFISALRKRISAQKDISQVASVASFFVSRVDSICEKAIESKLKKGEISEAKAEDLIGHVGIANSKMAYRRYEEIFGEPSYSEFKEKGAQVQRPLWASTGTKNPAFSPVLYVEALAGNNTVNTLPPQTLSALLKGASIEPRLHQDFDQASATISKLNESGIDLEVLLCELQAQGVALFSASYTSLVDSLEQKVKQLTK